MKQKGNIPIFLIIIILAAGAAVYFFVKSNMPTFQNLYPSPAPSPTNIVALKTFQSQLMKFSIQLSNDFQIEEKFTTVILSSSKGEILISRNGTNFKNLKDYLNDLDTKNKVTIVEQKTLSINDYEVFLRSEKYSGSEKMTKVYVIYVDNWVFAISTTSESLYDDLDPIAQSFRYTP